MAIPIIPLLLVGGVAMVAMAGGKKGTGRLLLVDANCQRVVYTPTNQGQIIALIRKVAKATADAMTNLGYHMTPSQAVSHEHTKQVIAGALGVAPGDQGANLAFAGDYGVEFARLTTDPKCLESGGGTSAAVLGVRDEMTAEFVALLAEYGYDVGIQFASAGPPEVLAHRVAGRIAR